VHKTGTSTFQKSFGEIRHHLAQNGFLYPAFGINEYEEFNLAIKIASSVSPFKWKIPLGALLLVELEKVLFAY
jgi:hypothetical protein